MRRIINYSPTPAARFLLGILPFIVIVLAYLFVSNERLLLNPNDKLMPSFATMAESMHRLMTVPDPAAREPLFWLDTRTSLARLAAGLGISALIGIVCGTMIGFVPYLRVAFEPFFAVLSLIPPLAVLPILFIAFGLGETSKIVLIVFGVAPFIVRDIALRVSEIPREQIVKAQTLGASTWQMLIGLVLPQVLPRLIASVRLSLGAAWLFVIASEAITANAGLGYRLFLVRRYLAMDVILPYVAWITLLAFIMDLALRSVSDRVFPWTRLKDV